MEVVDRDAALIRGVSLCAVGMTAPEIWTKPGHAGITVGVTQVGIAPCEPHMRTRSYLMQRACIGQQMPKHGDAVP